MKYLIKYVNIILISLEEKVVERDFRYLRDKFDDAGARDIFEKVCTNLFQAMYGTNAHSIKVSQGDGGIDVLVGDFSVPIDVYQCKYFIDGIDDPQKKQIRDSFKTAIKSNSYTMKKWSLCIPSIMTEKEFSWWSYWKAKKSKDYGIEVELLDGSYLLLQLKKYDLYNNIFDDDIRKSLNEICDYFSIQKKKITDEIIVTLSDVDNLYNDLVFVKKLEMANITDIDQCKNEYFNAEFAEQSIKSKGDEEQIIVYGKLKQKILSLWSTQYRLLKEETDGNILLARTYEKIEDNNLGTLDCSAILPEVGLIVKKGILHQLAEECSVGWLQDYKQKLGSLLGKENIDDIGLL